MVEADLTIDGHVIHSGAVLAVILDVVKPAPLEDVGMKARGPPIVEAHLVGVMTAQAGLLLLEDVLGGPAGWRPNQKPGELGHRFTARPILQFSARRLKPTWMEEEIQNSYCRWLDVLVKENGKWLLIADHGGRTSN
jgi:hypothetical protein